MNFMKLRKSWKLHITALSGIDFELFTIHHILRWKYCLTTLGHKTIPQKFPFNILFFLKNEYLRKMSGPFLFVFYRFCHCTDLILFQNFRPVYLGQKSAGEATFASPVGPRHTWWPTRNGSRADGRKTPFCAEKNHFRKYEKRLNFWLL